MKDTLINTWSRWWIKLLSIFLLIGLTLFLFRQPILRGIGNYLFSHDPLERTDAIFILGGNSYERGLEASQVYALYPGTPLISTGANIPLQLLAFDTTMTEAQLTSMLLKRKGVPDSLVIDFSIGTSTKEEAAGIRTYCAQHQYQRITVISSSFHLRRVRNVFEKEFSDTSVELRFHGSPSKDFDPEDWWKHEEGMITVNNELMKMLYYWLH